MPNQIPPQVKINKTVPIAPQPKPTPQPKIPSKTIEDKNLIESIIYLKHANLLNEFKSTIKFETTKEAEDSKKEDIVSVIKEKTNNIKQNVTELQKAGYNLHLETIKLIKVPLKTKVWISTLKKKDLEDIFKIIKEVNSIVLPLKKENDEKVQEEERLEKIENEKEQAKVREDDSKKSQKITTQSATPKPTPKINQSAKPTLAKSSLPQKQTPLNKTNQT